MEKVGEENFKRMYETCNRMYEEGKWLDDFTTVSSFLFLKHKNT
jgi:hypothetical protein